LLGFSLAGFIGKCSKVMFSLTDLYGEVASIYHEVYIVNVHSLLSPYPARREVEFHFYLKVSFVWKVKSALVQRQGVEIGRGRR